MIIIVEGPDGAGKTTLVKKFEGMGFESIHRNYPKNQAEKDAMYDMYVEAMKSKRQRVLDRAWYSEVVYGKIMRDESNITIAQMYDLEKRLMRHGAMIIYCKSDPKVLWRRCTLRGEDYVSSFETLKEISESYDELMLNMPHYIPVLTYET